MSSTPSRYLTEDDVADRPGSGGGVRLTYGTGPRHFGDLRLPPGPGPHPLAVLFHGGCWRDIAGPEYMEDLAEALGAAGWASWNVAYRRLGDDGGGWPGTFRDVADGTDHVRVLARDHPLDPERVVTVGHSAGGHLALWAASRPRIPAGSVLHDDDPLPIRGTVSLAGIADLETFRALDPAGRGCGDAVATLLGGEPARMASRMAVASPARLLPLGVPQLLVTGVDDPDVPVEHVRGYAGRAREAGDAVTHRVVPDAGHFEVVAPWSPRWPPVRGAIVEFLGEVGAS